MNNLNNKENTDTLEILLKNKGFSLMPSKNYDTKVFYSNFHVKTDKYGYDYIFVKEELSINTKEHTINQSFKIVDSNNSTIFNEINLHLNKIVNEIKNISIFNNYTITNEGGKYIETNTSSILVLFLIPELIIMSIIVSIIVLLC